MFVLYPNLQVFAWVCVCSASPSFLQESMCACVCFTAGTDGQHTNLFNSLGAWATDGGPLLLVAGPAPKTSLGGCGSG